MKISDQLKNKLKKIKILFLDFDGVMTDGFVYVDENGKEMVRCSRKDGLGIAMLKQNNIQIGVISKEANPVVSARCQKLKIPCWQNIKNGDGKKDILLHVIHKNHLSSAECAYMGDDVQDLPALSIVGVKFAPSDAHQLVKKIADYITQASGGNHAVREVTDLLLESKNIPLSY